MGWTSNYNIINPQESGKDLDIGVAIEPRMINLDEIPGFFHIADFNELPKPSENQMGHIKDLGLRGKDLEDVKIVPAKKAGGSLTVAVKTLQQLDISSIMLVSQGKDIFNKNLFSDKKCVERWTVNYDDETIHDLDHALTFRIKDTNIYHSYFISCHFNSMGYIVRVQIKGKELSGVFNVDQDGEMEFDQGNLTPEAARYLAKMAVSWLRKAYPAPLSR